MNKSEKPIKGPVPHYCHKDKSLPVRYPLDALRHLPAGSSVQLKEGVRVLCLSSGEKYLGDSPCLSCALNVWRGKVCLKRRICFANFRPDHTSVIFMKI